MRRFLPNTSVSGRLLTLLVACVLVPGAALGYFGIRAVLHEDVLQDARLRQRAHELTDTFASQLDLRAQRLAERLDTVRDQQGDLWWEQPSLAAAAVVEAEPRVLQVAILGGEHQDQLLHPLALNESDQALLELILAVPRADNPSKQIAMTLSPLRAGPTNLMLAEGQWVSADRDVAVRILLVLSSDVLLPDAEDLLATAARSHPEFRADLQYSTQKTNKSEDPGFEVQHALQTWLPGYMLSVQRGKDGVLKGVWRRQQLLRLGLVAILLLMIVVGMLVLIHGVSREIEVARLKSDFVSNVSHELRTPLTTIRIMAEMLSLGAVPSGEKQAEYHRNIVSEAERLTRLINNVLDFARIQEGRKKFQFGVGDLGDIVYEVERIIGDYVKREGFVLTTNVDGALPAASFDRDAMLQALINLTSNAVKYTEDDRRIEIGACAERDTIRLWVADHGPGIDPKELPHLFEKFFRGGDHMTREVGGTGLGLAIVQHIVGAHGGTVSVESELGKGSTFEIRLPVAAPNAATAV